MIHILLVFGTRPEVIKVAPIIAEFKKHPGKIKCTVCLTGQHRQMVEPLLKLFNIKADYDLNVMKANQNLEHITTTVLQEISKIIIKERPDYLMVQGDTTTAMAASLAAFYNRVKVAHVEAGLRTWDIHHPYPEEVNRRIIDSLAEVFFAHTDAAKQNLINEGVAPAKIEVTGNTVIDALLDTVGRKFDIAKVLPKGVSLKGRKVILVTAHRRENFDEPIKNICRAITTLAAGAKNDLLIIYPVHLNPNIKAPVLSILGKTKNVILTEPMDYLPFVHLMKAAHIILTDSGGVQEEAPSLGKPVLVMRQTTERPEGVKAGCVEVIGTDADAIVRKVKALLEDPKKYSRMAKAKNPYGDGRASERIVRRLFRGKA